MFRASPPRGEDAPAVQEPSDAHSTSFESLLALLLCAVVTLASVAFLRRSSDLSRALTRLQDDSLQAAPVRARVTPTPASQPRPEFVLLISLDGLRADHLDLYGYTRETAPNLHSLGESALVFRTVLAQSSQALTSHKSLFTGKYPATLMFEATGADLVELAAQRAAREYLVRTFSGVEGTLAEGFRAQGFYTAGFTDGGWTGRASGFAHGFDVFDDAGGGLAASVPRALAWLENHAAHPAFLFLHADDLHCPYAAPEPYDGAFCPDHAEHAPIAGECADGAPSQRTPHAPDVVALTDHYDGALLASDAVLGRLFDALRARGLFERALIVVTSGHGESLGERGVVGHGGLYLEQLLVPLIVKLPQSWNVAPRRVDEPVELVDVLPTLDALCGVSAPGDLDGHSLLPAVFRGVHGRDTLVAQTTFEEGAEQRSSAAERTLLKPGRWQVIHDVEHSEASFFALEDDPRALAAHPIGAQEFAPLLDLLLERGRAEGHALYRSARPAAFGAELEHELGRLGYAAALAAPERDAAGPGARRDLR